MANDLSGTLTEGGTVSSWPNPGNDGDAAQADASKRPTFHAGAGGLFGGHAHVGFNESTDNDEVMEITGVAAHGSATLIAVFSQDDANPHHYGIFALYGNTTDRVSFVTRRETTASDPLAYWDRTHLWKQSSYVVPVSSAHVGVWRVNAGVAVDFQVDGTARGSVALSGPIHQPFNRYLVGATEPSTIERFDGQIAELLLYDRPLSDCERDNVVADLGSRYGVSVAVTGGMDCNPPAAPSGLSASAVASNRIDLTWTDNATNETGFRIERRQGQTGAFAEIATVGTGATTYSNGALAPTTEYCYRVRAFNNAGDSNYSGIACATTPAVTAPSGLSVTATGSDRIDLTWIDNATNETGFRIERREAATGTWSLITTVGPNVSMHTNEGMGLLAETEYCFHVAAFNAGGVSDFSNESCATTTAIEPVACTPGLDDARSELIEILSSSKEFYTDWRAQVGLSGVDPNDLVLVDEDAICDRLWRSVAVAAPKDGYHVTFFQIGDLYMVTDYPNSDLTLGPRMMGYAFTSVVDVQFNPVDPLLVE